MGSPSTQIGSRRFSSRHRLSVRNGLAASAIGLFGWIAGGAPPVHAAAGDLELASVGQESNNAGGANRNGRPAISANGRFVLFARDRGRLLVLRDTWRDTSQVLNIPWSGQLADGFTSADGLTPDARFAAFSSLASNLVPGDANGTWDVFRRDRQTGTTVRVSVDLNGGDANGASVGSAISDDGRFVAFRSQATDLGAANPDSPPIFVRDLQNGTTQRLITNSPWPLQGPVESVTMSGDGRYVAFEAQGPGALAQQNAFVHDRFTGTTRRVSLPEDGDPLAPSHGGTYPAISADGRFVAYQTWAGTFDENPMIFVRNLQTGVETRESYGVGPWVRDQARAPWISGNGRFVAFQSGAWNLVPGMTVAHSRGEIYVRDTVTGGIQWISQPSDGGRGNYGSHHASISRDGRWVAFLSKASNLVENDFNGIDDAYLFDRGPTYAFTLRPTSRDYETVALGSSKTRPFQLVNTGTLELPITNVMIVGTGAVAYTVTVNTCGASVQVGDSCTFDVTFTPTNVRTYEARLRVESTAGVVRTSNLTGAGVQ